MKTKTNSTLIKLTIILLFVSSVAKAQQSIKSEHLDRWDMLTYDLGNMVLSMGYSYSRPFYWKGKDWVNVRYTVGSTDIAYLFDTPTSNYYIGIQDDVPNSIREYGSRLGSPSNNYLITSSIYLTGLAIIDEKLRRTGILLIASTSSAGLFISGIYKTLKKGFKSSIKETEQPKSKSLILLFHTLKTYILEIQKSKWSIQTPFERLSLLWYTKVVIHKNYALLLSERMLPKGNFIILRNNSIIKIKDALLQNLLEGKRLNIYDQNLNNNYILSYYWFLLNSLDKHFDPKIIQPIETTSVGENETIEQPIRSHLKNISTTNYAKKYY